ncbi:hypothetical protein CFK37_03860 [Virgibacillus phasianinus]|uniref:Uncharacterized protein n=1 Tax=Virgibacillus phasianinus TaxID=2017483 RepID=A0A220TZW5_9BACI|nr:hypothetical protein [Virgibacillus phasianinus]ASK61367.1 hypothetical protein CFK37_03860 [Virgibacillus phasianinus]
MPVTHDFEKELANRYTALLSAKEKEVLYPDNEGYKWKREKLETLYQDTVLKSKYPKERLKNLEEEVQKEQDNQMNQAEQFKQAYKQGILQKLQFTKEETNYKDAYKQEVLKSLNKEPSEKETPPDESKKGEQEMKDFEAKHGYEKVYMLKREVLDEIKEMDLTPVQKEKVNQIEKGLEQERLMKLGNKKDKNQENDMEM